MNELNTISIPYSIPESLNTALISLWHGQYRGIDFKGRTDFKQEAQNFLALYKSLKPDNYKTDFIHFAYIISLRAKKWLDIEEVFQDQTMLLLQEIERFLEQSGPFHPDLEKINSIFSVTPTMDQQLDEALIILHDMARLIKSENTIVQTAKLWNHSLSTGGVVIPNHEKRKLLNWSLSEGISAIYLGKPPQPISTYLF